MFNLEIGGCTVESHSHDLVLWPIRGCVPLFVSQRHAKTKSSLTDTLLSHPVALPCQILVQKSSFVFSYSTFLLRFVTALGTASGAAADITVSWLVPSQTTTCLVLPSQAEEGGGDRHRHGQPQACMYVFCYFFSHMWGFRSRSCTVGGGSLGRFSSVLTLR